MRDFTLHNPTRLLFGRGRIASLDQEIPPDAHVMVMAGGGSIRRNGVFDQVQAALGSRPFDVFWGIEPNPRFETLMMAVERIRAGGQGFLLAVGGGSVIDGTKFTAAAVSRPADPWALCQRRIKPEKPLPFGVVLTLPATGSEMNGNAVITREALREKRSFGHPTLFPRFAILDPETTLSLPPRQISNGVVDAFVHVLEQYLTYPADAPLQDRLAEAVLLTLKEEGPKALAHPTALPPRANLMYAATMALQGVIGAGVPQDWSTHHLGHELTALYGLDHAQTLALLLPHVLWEQRAHKREKLLQYGERVWGVSAGDPDDRVRAAIDATRHFFEDMGQRLSLAACGIDEDPVEIVLGRLEVRGAFPMGERRDLDAEKARRILGAIRR